MSANCRTATNKQDVSYALRSIRRNRSPTALTGKLCARRIGYRSVIVDAVYPNAIAVHGTSSAVQQQELRITLLVCDCMCPIQLPGLLVHAGTDTAIGVKSIHVR